MAWYCDRCGRFFTAHEADYRLAELEDGRWAGWRIVKCPSCGSEEIFESDYCEMCGKPVMSGKALCQDCEERLDELTENLFDKINKNRDRAKMIYFDYLEREWF